MVFMAMGNNDTSYLLLILHKVADVGDYQVDTQHFLPGEHKTGIDNHDVVLVLNRHHVLADFG
ncbi:hypothetical protein ES708_30422 [subsurface metagenome]